MDEAAIRQLVRDALQRHVQLGVDPAQSTRAVLWKTHHSHVRFLTLPSGDGSCIVEPAARCTHCGFCQSYGH